MCELDLGGDEMMEKLKSPIFPTPAGKKHAPIIASFVML